MTFLNVIYKLHSSEPRSKGTTDHSRCSHKYPKLALKISDPQFMILHVALNPVDMRRDFLIESLDLFDKFNSPSGNFFVHLYSLGSDLTATQLTESSSHLYVTPSGFSLVFASSGRATGATHPEVAESQTQEG